jgi:hypothetical protein
MLSRLRWKCQQDRVERMREAQVEKFVIDMRLLLQSAVSIPELLLSGMVGKVVSGSSRLIGYPNIQRGQSARDARSKLLKTSYRELMYNFQR